MIFSHPRSMMYVSSSSVLLICKSSLMPGPLFGFCRSSFLLTPYPPITLSQIAEMEAAEDFVEQMAWLAYLDECDEEARNKPINHTKRWSARRVEGLRGKPTPPKPKTMTMAGMNEEWNAMCSNSNYVETMLVPHVKNGKLYENRPRDNSTNKRMIHRAGKRSCDPKYGGKGKMRGHQGIIQTPRK